MSSSRPRDTRWRTPARWPLRARLIAEQVVLLSLVCVIIGVVTGFALRDFLVQRLDQQLTQTAGRAGFGPGRDDPMFMADPPSRSGEHVLNGPGFGPGTLVFETLGGTVEANRVDTAGALETIADQATLTTLSSVPADGRPRTVELGALGGYRVVSAQFRTGTVVTGLPLSEVSSTVLRMGLILGGVALGGLITVGLAGALIIRRTLEPLERVAATAGRVAELPLHEGEVALAERVPAADATPDTEVGQVGLALNRMLGHVGEALSARHASETRVRQFVADASHELRTPLAAIRGYAELTRRSREVVSPEIAHAMGRVESEAVRMTSLVEDLLLLARLDAGRPLELGEVDLSRLVVDSVSDARIAGREHDWRLALPPEAVTVRGDADRVRQVLANLLSNARAHTPPGTTVTTVLNPGRAGWVDLVVADDGPGIPEALQPEVFERFARGDSSRSRAAGSTGLGLSIVAAVVSAHGGSVRVDSRPGATRFTVSLPAS
ncbi:HAMP domain-containing histidine kinase [Actinosynnema pretiosum subsp. pretiosum]|uniref:histidine kinase n=1 Tax=Actinosynnema pretiosum subsp. pretiosum TaxID=103721 RepID=A0AA45LB31_9PSEU|nr:Two-component system, sensor protein [Actinosynnema pretiosum subsp. pretiosum]QUF06626.1 HAMP domain-containing histidine kinase [Actinosynnema pretiosum subsp. pretiosum]